MAAILLYLDLNLSLQPVIITKERIRLSTMERCTRYTHDLAMTFSHIVHNVLLNTSSVLAKVQY
jgi:hypothetical protein